MKKVVTKTITARQALWFCLFILLVPCTSAASWRPLAAVPDEIASTHFTVTIDGRQTPVMHAAVNLYFLNFQARKHLTLSVTAATEAFWARGVEVQPWRLGIRPTRSGRTITFQLDGVAQISISRPGDFLGNAEMLYIFANPAEVKSPAGPQAGPMPAGLRYFGPGAHRENIDAVSGDQIYLAPGAVVFGALNLWQVNHVKVFGRGVIVYDGPQNPVDDDGWMHKRNWHCIVMDEASDITIEGITCVVRSRTWQIQMKDSHNILFDNIKVIGANTGNANADGMDWLGGGDTIVRNSFFRAADDIFALQTSWEGYGPKAFALQGHPVSNIIVENTVLSTSISNIVRAGWPEKNFEGGGFTLRNSDVLHVGLGGCGIPFALMELWADPKGRGASAGFHFDDIRIEHGYSLLQLRQAAAGSLRDVRFTDVASLEQPSLVPSVVQGNVSGVVLDNVTLASVRAQSAAEIPLQRTDEAPEVALSAGGSVVHVSVRVGLIKPGQKVLFEAQPTGEARSDLHYAWSFGDGQRATGRKVKHKFPDTDGTLLDGSGRFRVLLDVSTPAGRHTWSYVPVVISHELHPAMAAVGSQPGLAYEYQENEAHFQTAASLASGITATLDLTAVPHRPADYSLSWSGMIEVASDGGYTFDLVAGDSATLELDGQQLITNPEPFAQVCGLAGNAARLLSVSQSLAKGPHRLRVTESHGAGEDPFKLLWQGPGFNLQPVPSSALSHASKEP